MIYEVEFGIFLFLIESVYFVSELVFYLFKMDEVVSKRNIFGTFVNYDVDEEIIVSVKLNILTIVTRSIKQLPQKVRVLRCYLIDRTQEISNSEIVEKSSILDEDVYMKITMRAGPGQNRIEVFEFKLCSDERKEHLKLDHSEFQYGLVTFFFVEKEGTQFIKVSSVVCTKPTAPNI